MDDATARRMSALTTDFYQRVSSSFADTRQAPWTGWRRLLEPLPPRDEPLRVLDVACGNLRFERYLANEGVAAQAWAVDNCDDLVALACEVPLPVELLHVDVAAALWEPGGLEKALADVLPCDLAVCFGFMHHVPLAEHRMRLLQSLVGHAAPGGLIAVSLWQFMHDERLRAKAEPVPAGDAGDYLLGWQGRSDVRRYCHSFGEDEVDALAASVAPDAQELARFSADGRSGDLNRYLVLRRAPYSA